MRYQVVELKDAKMNIAIRTRHHRTFDPDNLKDSLKLASLSFSNVRARLVRKLPTLFSVSFLKEYVMLSTGRLLWVSSFIAAMAAAAASDREFAAQTTSNMYARRGTRELLAYIANSTQGMQQSA